MLVRIEFDPNVRGRGNGLMHRTTVRDLQQSFSLICRDAMRKVDRNVDTAHTMRSFRHRPFRLDGQTVSGDTMSPAELSDEVRNTARDRPNIEFNRTHAGILPSILNRLVGDDSMLPAHNVVPCPAVKGRREFHVALPPGSFTAPHRQSTPSGNAMSSPSTPNDP